MRRLLILSYFLFLILSFLSAQPKPIDYVDPRIGSEGEGRVFVGPSCPYGMVKPSPDCTSLNNSGWAAMPTQVDGFSQTHVSGTGGGPKYGNVLIQPFCADFEATSHPQYRASETCLLGIYQTIFETGIHVQVTASEHASYYVIHYPDGQPQCLTVDAGWFLGNHSAPDLREQQQFVGSEVEVRGDHEVSGFTRIRGGWNNGRAYTVYFHLIADRPFRRTLPWDKQGQRGVNVEFDHAADSSPDHAATDDVHVTIGISFVGERQARQNAHEQTGFMEAYRHCTQQWESLLNRVELDPATPDREKRMFYTALYHTILEPVDRTGENPGWTDYVSNDPQQGLVPYYDDFYAIWDTYRTSLPLITLLDPERQTRIVNSLLNIYTREGYLPDARSGNCNGRTQGGSNADIVLADALAKGLEGIDWDVALRAMLQDATVPPGGNEEAEGRGGLIPYLTLGYVPYGIPRAGTRTVEYAFDDWAIAQVAKHLGQQDLYEQYILQSGNWKNLWRADYANSGAHGFILPRDKDGQWLDHLPFGHSRLQPQTFSYDPTVSYEGPWYVKWWDCFFYEASSWEYSLAIPHDVPGLIEACGGREAFEQRLDTFFSQRYYNVANEPSFLTPCLYHWIDRPDKTSDRVLQIIRDNYDDTPRGIPGNDDSGAMSSWLAFHMMGLYPNAGHDYYLLHTPVLRQTMLHLTNGRTLTIRAPKLSDRNFRVKRILLNGTELSDHRITHQQLLQGGELVFEMTKGPTTLSESVPAPVASDGQEALRHAPYLATFSLHGQTRRFNVNVTPQGDGSIRLDWGMQRHANYWTGSYTMTATALANAQQLCYQQPVWHQHLTLDASTFLLLSRHAYHTAKSAGCCHFNNTYWIVTDTHDHLLHLVDQHEAAEMWVKDDPALPLIMRMQNNPNEIDWNVTPLNLPRGGEL